MSDGRGRCSKRDVANRYKPRAVGVKSYHRHPLGFQVPGKQTRIWDFPCGVDREGKSEGERKKGQFRNQRETETIERTETGRRRWLWEKMLEAKVRKKSRRKKEGERERERGMSIVLERSGAFFFFLDNLIQIKPIGFLRHLYWMKFYPRYVETSSQYGRRITSFVSFSIFLLGLWVFQLFPSRIKNA